MGNKISDTNSEKRGSNPQPFQWAWSALTPRIEKEVIILLNLKLASQNIVGFSGRIKDRQKWKNRTLCAFVGSGYDAVLKKKSTVVRNPQCNQVVYSQLAVATSGGTAYHLVKAHKKERDGYDVWQSLLE
eukprot:1757236-Ditylum_brightwellii.AAC.1